MGTNQPNGAIQGLTFDFWNTLMVLEHPKQVLWERVNQVQQALDRCGYVFTPVEILRQIEEIWKLNLDNQYQRGLDLTPTQQVEKLFELLKIPELKDSADCFQSVYTGYAELLLRCPPTLMPGALETIAALAQHFPLAIICNTGFTPGSVLRQILDQKGIRKYFQVLTFSNELGIAKPNPTIFRQTLQQLGVPENAAVHIGDDLRTDIAGANGVGMRTVWFNSLNLKLPEQPAYTWTIKGLNDLLSLFIPK